MGVTRNQNISIAFALMQKQGEKFSGHLYHLVNFLPDKQFYIQQKNLVISRPCGMDLLSCITQFPALASTQPVNVHLQIRVQ